MGDADDVLNTPQRSALTITLRMFEQDLRQAEAWLQDAKENGLLYRSDLHLSPESKAATRQMIKAALQEIGELAREFDLVPVDNDLAATIVAAMSTNWTHLCDLRADTLKRYGEVDPRLAPRLDPRVERLAKLALLLASAVRGEK